MRNIISLFLTVVGCESQPPEVIVLPGEDHTVTETNTVTITVTETVPAEIPPMLQVSYTTVLASNGDWMFETGDTNINFGGVQFVATEEPVTVTAFVFQTYVNADPGIGTYFTSGSQNGVIFADHFQNCVIEDYTTGNVIAGPVNVDLNGRIVFTDDFTVDPVTGAPIYSVLCDHTGLAPVGENDAFAIDLFMVDASAQDMNGDPVEIAAGNYNGGSSPSMDRILEDPSFEGTLAFTFNGPPTLSLFPGIYNFPVLDLSATSSPEDVAVKGLQLQFTGDIAVVDEVRLWYVDIAGFSHQVAAPLSYTGEVTFAGLDLRVPTGANDMNVSINVSALAQSGEWIQAALVIDGIDAVGLTSGEPVDPAMNIFPSSNIVGNVMTVP